MNMKFGATLFFTAIGMSFSDCAKPAPADMARQLTHSARLKAMTRPPCLG